MHAKPEQVLLKRQVRAIQIPEGDEVELAGDQPVLITQSLGGNYTVQTIDNRKFRIAGKDADALGKEVPEEMAEQEDQEPLEPEEAEKRAWEVLKKVHDPEIPVNLVDLGLIYELDMHKRGDGKLFAEVKMTLTAPGCGMGDFLIQDVEEALKTLPGVETVDAQIVFEPVWNPYTMMSDAAKLQLGMM